jgi:CysZ protein
MLRALGLAVADLADRQILAIMAQALAVTLLIFVLLGGLLFWLFAGADPCSSVGMDSCPLDTGAGGLGAVLLTLLALWFVFPAVAIAVVTTFTDRVARAVEECHYPDSAREARPIGIIGALGMGLRSAGRLLLFNLLALPFYLLLLVTGIGPFILFVIVNGIAFGRDLAELAAARHGDRASRRAWLRSTRGRQHAIGLVVSTLFLVPIANFFAPIIGAAAGVHLFNRSFWASNGHRNSPVASTARSTVSRGH